MKWKTFTPKEVSILRENPYTLKVTDKTIVFTREFKQQFWEGLQQGRTKFELLKETIVMCRRKKDYSISLGLAVKAWLSP